MFVSALCGMGIPENMVIFKGRGDEARLKVSVGGVIIRLLREGSERSGWECWKFRTRG